MPAPEKPPGSARAALAGLAARAPLGAGRLTREVRLILAYDAFRRFVRR